MPPSSAARKLVFLFHAYTFSPEKMGHVADAVRAAMPEAEITIPSLPFSLFSSDDLITRARKMLALIDEQVASSEGCEEIILVGHSIGGLLARKIYLLASGETEDARFEDTGEGPLQPARPWVGKVKRIVLLAGMNRGWSISHHMGLGRAVAMSIGSFVGHVLYTLTRKPLLIFQVRRGAPFLTQLRLQWIALERRKKAANESEPVTVVQLLGSVDDVVSPEDNIDLVTGQGFVYLDIPWSGHANVIELDDSLHGRARRDIFLRALTESREGLRRDAILPADHKTDAADDAVENVIFVVHGIRDTGYWTQKIARAVQKLGKSGPPPKVYGAETSTYGYFAMFPFLLPARRREKVEWLMDQYVEAQALYPKARFSCVAHSNGTYLLAKALTDYPACRFDQVVFAGSVVPRAYRWLEKKARGQVSAVLNYTATADFVVAWFPGALEKLRLQDLGSAGHNGFDGFLENETGRWRYPARAVGGHGAALSEDHWDEIAHFIVHGRPLHPDAPADFPRREWWVVFGGWIAPLIWVGIAAALIWIGMSIWKLPASEWLRTLAEVGFVWVIWKILTKV